MVTSDNNYNHNYKILIIEKNTSSVSDVFSLFFKAGFMLDVVEHGKEAFRIINHAQDKYKHDLVVLDLDLPDIEPLEIVRQIRTMFLTTLHVPVIAIVDQALQNSIPWNSGIVGCVSKPVTADMFYPLLTKVNVAMANTLRKCQIAK